jgi:molybdopterin-containing oxidoreductase family membrane subunit
VIAICTYLAGSLLYLYLPLIPDLALCRDAIGERVMPLKRWFYATFAVGWRGAPDQRRRLAQAMGLMMVIIIPVAVSVHTVVSWIFAMTLRAGWNSAVFGAYFVAGAIFSGIATIIVIMAVLRRVYHLEAFITYTQFRNLGLMLGTFAVIMAYFNISEYLTIGYKLPHGEDVLLVSLFSGQFAPYLWSDVLAGLVTPSLLVFLPWTRTIPGIVLAAVLVDVAMWIERYLIVVASLSVPLMPGAPPTYFPSWVEWSIVAAAFAGFMLAITLFSRLFPVISVWEVEEQDEQATAVPIADVFGPELAIGPEV